MKKLFAILAVAGLVLAAGSTLGCEMFSGGATKEKIEELEGKIENLEDDLNAYIEAHKWLQMEYYEHLEEYHGEEPPPPPPPTSSGGGSSGSSGGGTTEPPTLK